MDSAIDRIIGKLFSERWTENLALAPIEDQRKQLFKTLRDQTNGYWSGHTAYHLAVDGGFLIDGKSNTNKQLTELGKIFMESMDSAGLEISVSHKGLKKFDVVEVVTNPRQEQASLATVLELTSFQGEEAAVIQYHNNSCSAQTVAVSFMKKHTETQLDLEEKLSSCKLFVAYLLKQTEGAELKNQNELFSLVTDIQYEAHQLLVEEF